MKRLATPTSQMQTRRGAAAIEMALTLPVLLLLAFGCVDLGRAASAKIVVCNAARAGAEYGSTRGMTTFNQATWEQAIRDEVETEMQGIPSFDDAKLSVSIITADGDYDLDIVSVTVAYNFDTVTGWPGIPASISLNHTVSMQRFR
jgi:Flp pilus assembly protein TadG